MNTLKNLTYLLLFAMFCFTACTPKTETLMSNDLGDDEYVEKEIDPTKTEKIAEFGKKDEIDLDKKNAKKIIGERFNGIQSVNNIQIQRFKNTAPYYVTASGKKNGENIIVAIELLRKGEQLHTSEYNTLHTACVEKACDTCSLTIDKNGEIMDCRCEKGTNTPEAVSPCEHRMFIKTLEKDF